MTAFFQSDVIGCSYGLDKLRVSADQALGSVNRVYRNPLVPNCIGQEFQIIYPARDQGGSQFMNNALEKPTRQQELFVMMCQWLASANKKESDAFFSQYYLALHRVLKKFLKTRLRYSETDAETTCDLVILEHYEYCHERTKHGHEDHSDPKLNALDSQQIDELLCRRLRNWRPKIRTVLQEAMQFPFKVVALSPSELEDLAMEGNATLVRLRKEGAEILLGFIRAEVSGNGQVSEDVGEEAISLMDPNEYEEPQNTGGQANDVVSKVLNRSDRLVRGLLKDTKEANLGNKAFPDRRQRLKKAWPELATCTDLEHLEATLHLCEVLFILSRVRMQMLAMLYWIAEKRANTLMQAKKKTESTEESEKTDDGSPLENSSLLDQFLDGDFGSETNNRFDSQKSIDFYLEIDARLSAPARDAEQQLAKASGELERGRAIKKLAGENKRYEHNKLILFYQYHEHTQEEIAALMSEKTGDAWTRDMVRTRLKDIAMLLSGMES